MNLIRRLLASTAAVLALMPAATLVAANAASPRPAGTATATAAASDNPIVVENRRPGSDGWRIPWAGKSVATDRDMGVKGFASEASIDQGQRLGVHVHAASPGPATYDVYRLGWYQGLGGRHVLGGSFTAPSQPTCETTMPEGLITCPWSETLSIPTSADWTTGVYVVVLTRGTYQSYVPFVVRDDARKGAIVHMQATLTWQAYNMFPNDGATGKSLYAYNSSGPLTVNGTTSAVKVSFDRPYWDSGAGSVMVDDAPVVRYQESRGFDVTYLTDLDLHRDPGLVRGQRALVSVGHDEYWTSEMFTGAEDARDAGVDLAFLGGNNIYWQVRLEPSDSGQAERVVVCYRDATIDPVTDSTRTIRFRDLPRPEQPLIGQMWPSVDGAGMVKSDADWVVREAGHWLYRGSGLAEGSTIPSLVGVEADRRLPEYPAPSLASGTAEAVLAQSPYVTRYDGQAYQEATLYTAPSGAMVFSAGTLRYPRGLMGEGSFAQQTVRTMTTNLFTRFGPAALDASVTRLAGATRYETAVRLSQAGFPNGGVPLAFLATGATYPDALAASAATRGRGPVLLVPGTVLPTAVANELARLRPGRLVVVGGEGAISTAVVKAASGAAGVTAERIGGTDRYETAAKVSQALNVTGVPIAYVATGLDFPDALAAGAAGAQLGGPVLLTAPTALSQAAKDELVRLAPGRVVVVGGPSVVSESVKAAVASITPNVVRLAGADRYETSLAVARDTRPAGRVSTMAVATGLDFPDALAAGPLVAASGGVLTLSRAQPGAAVAEEGVRTDPQRVFVVGGSGVLPDSVLTALEALYATAAPSATSVPVLPAPSDNPTLPNDGPQLLSPSATRTTSAGATVGTDELPGADEPLLPWLSLPASEWQHVGGQP